MGKAVLGAIRQFRKINYTGSVLRDFGVSSVERFVRSPATNHESRFTTRIVNSSE